MYTMDLAAEVCRRISDGESLRQVCRDESMPSTSTVLKWARELPEFSQQYAKAREDLLEHWAEEITDIADDGSNDWIKREHESGRLDLVPDSEHINRSRLRVDTRKWLLSKLAPKKYGERVAAELSGPDGKPIAVADVSEAEYARRIAFALSQGLQLKAPE
jgi:hypothetical protein